MSLSLRQIAAALGLGAAANQGLKEETGTPISAPPSNTLPIYTAEEGAKTLVPVKLPLQDEVSATRESVERTIDLVKSHVSLATSWGVEQEQSVESKLRGLIAPKEEAFPGVFYVGIATLAGSIIARNRSIISRIAFPPLFFAGSLAYFLPQTADQGFKKYEAFEKENVPELTKARHQLLDAVRGSK